MDQHATTSDYAGERAALCAAGISHGLASFIIDAFRQHDAAGRPPIELPSREEASLNHEMRAVLVPLLIADADASGEAPEPV